MRLSTRPPAVCARVRFVLINMHTDHQPSGFLASLLSSAVYSPPSENWLWAVGTGLLLLAANAIHAAGYFYMVRSCCSPKSKFPTHVCPFPLRLVLLVLLAPAWQRLLRPVCTRFCDVSCCSCEFVFMLCVRARVCACAPGGRRCVSYFRRAVLPTSAVTVYHAC